MKTIRVRAVLFVLLACFIVPVTGQELAPLMFSVDAGVGLPLGTDAEIFKMGTSLRMDGDLALLASPRVSVLPGLSVLLSDPRDPASGLSSLTLAEVHAGLGFGLSFGALSLSLHGEGGGYLALMGGDTGMSAFVGGGLALGYRLFGPVSVRLSAVYRNYLGFYSDVLATGGVAVALGGKPGAVQAPAGEKPKAKPLAATASAGGGSLRIPNVDLKPVFPIFYKYYDTNPLGTIVVSNAGSSTAKNVSVEFFVKQFMDNAKSCGDSFDLAAGDKRTVELKALFSDSILQVSEGTKVSATITVRWSGTKGEESQQSVQTLTVYNRNALTWDDDRRAAAFVTAKDPEILRFARNTMGALSDTKRFNLPQAFLAGMLVHEALADFRIQYIKDPSTSYESLAKDATTVDFIQFPRQTLDFKGGDCDDLSALYCSLLQAIGVSTAFVTVPGHIFIAVDLALKPDEARSRFTKYDNLVFEGDKSWLPIEVTMVTPGFLNAWEEAAKEWREGFAKGLARLYPVEAAWKVYEPVGFTSEKVSIEQPSAQAVKTACLAEIGRFVDQQIYLQVAKLQADIAKEQGSPRSVNKLGTLYAMNGLYDRAKSQFLLAIQKGDYAPALVNLGNLAYVDKDLKAAQAFYQRAFAKDGSNPKVVLALARVNHELENYGSSKELFEKLKALDPTLAAQFAYLDLRGSEATRAADITGAKDVVIWSD